MTAPIQWGWEEVTRKDPCQICGNKKFCAFSAVKNCAMCMVTTEGPGVVSGDGALGAYGLHFLGDDNRTAAPLPPAKPKPQCAPPEELNRAYKAMLGVLKLSDDHASDLRYRGLYQKQIEENGYRTLPAVSERQPIIDKLRAALGGTLPNHVPGITINNDGPKLHGMAGVFIPVRDADESIRALKIRVDDPGDYGKYQYLSSSKVDGPSPGDPCHVPLGTRKRLEGMKTKRAGLTEGPLKADVASGASMPSYYVTDDALRDVVDTERAEKAAALKAAGVKGFHDYTFPYIGMSSAGSWRTAIPVLKDLGVTNVVLAWDADASKPPKVSDIGGPVRKNFVATSLQDAAHGLTAEGFIVELVTWEVNESFEPKGIDDALKKGPCSPAPSINIHSGPRVWTEIVKILKAAEQEPKPETIERERVTSLANHGTNAPIAPEVDSKDVVESAKTLIASLPDRAKTEGAARVAMSPEFIAAALVLHQHARAEYAQLKMDLQRLKVPIKEWSASVQECHESKQKAEKEKEKQSPENDDDKGEDAEATEYTEFYLRDILVENHGQDFRHIKGDGWQNWTGPCWKEDQRGCVMERAFSVLENAFDSFVDDIVGQSNSDDTDKVETAAKGMASFLKTRRFQSAIVALSESHPQIAMVRSDFDRNPMILTCTNGTIDLTTGQLYPHRREDYATRMSPVAFNPEASRQVWDGFLCAAQPDRDVRLFLQRYAGYVITGLIREHVFGIHWGGGRNGKSTFVNAVAYVLGDFAKQIRPSVLMEKRNESNISDDEAVLEGLRLAASSEPKARVALEMALIKRLTGGEPINARKLYSNLKEFQPTHKLWFSCNPRPSVDDQSDATWNRLLFTPWMVSFYGRENFKLADELRTAEAAAGILAWAVEGCSMWQKEGLAPPAVVKNATVDLRDENDVVGQFLSECCEITASHSALFTPVFEAFKAWCIDRSMRPMSQKVFGSKMIEISERKSFSHGKIHGLAGYRGLRLFTVAEIQENAKKAAEAADEEEAKALREAEENGRVADFGDAYEGPEGVTRH